VITWIQLYAQHANFWLHAFSMRYPEVSDVAKRPCARRDSGNGRVIWASERFAAKRRSRDRVAAKRLGSQSAS
jgi:hypothetical protein